MSFTQGVITVSDLVMDTMPKVTSSVKQSRSEITIGSKCQLTLHDIHSLVSQNARVNLSADAYAAMDRSHQLLQASVDKRIPIYGINTHFGDQVTLFDANMKNPDLDAYHESITARQVNLIKSHSCGLGDVVKPETVRIAMLLRTHCLSQGYSGVTPSTIHTLISFLNSGITPIVRQYGSVGASGDLIPLAMIAAGVIGEDVDVLYQGEIMRSPVALEKAGLKKLKPQLRDGLAMINGTSFMTAIASHSLYKLQRLFNQMLFAIGMTLESMMVITSAYHPLVHELKRQTGEKSVNSFLLNFWQGSQLLSDLDELRSASVQDSASGLKPVQDYYSLRSVCQGFGTFHENLERATEWVEREMNSVNDNPIVDVAENKIYHNANFMGYYITEACDILKMDIAQASTWIHALLAILVHPRKNNNLPANLVSEPGSQNGFRPLQLLTAALAVQNRKLAQAHQAYMLPTEGDNQDVNSLGTHAAFDFQQSVENLQRITAILLLASTQALEFRGIEKASKNAQAIRQVIRTACPKIADCRPMTEDLEAVIQLLDAEKI
jgi:histidine ammonia-lyase